MKTNFLLLLGVLAAPHFVDAQNIRGEGVLGNSGEQGKSLVRYAPKNARGIGVVCDRFGSLWSAGGDGQLNRYASDGRLLAQYEIPKGAAQSDQLTAVGDLLVMQIAGKLYSMPVSGGDVKPIGRNSDTISFGSANGAIASRVGEEIFLINVATGAATKLAQVKGARDIELGPDGALYVAAEGDLRKFVGGAEVTTDWPKSVPGDRMQWLDGYWFGHAWHGTVKRFNVDLEAEPGVVLGGASGSFIGHLEEDPDVNSGRGMAKVRPGLFALSGQTAGAVMLLDWREDKQRMEIVRRIGALPWCRGIALDRDGNVWAAGGFWTWNDTPEAPLKNGMPAPEAPGIGQAVMLDGDNMVAPMTRYGGKPHILSGKLRDEKKLQSVTGAAFDKNFTGSAVYKADGRLILLVIGQNGAGLALRVGPDGQYQGNVGAVALKTATPVKMWTSLAMKDETTLLGTADGAVIEMARAGNDWQETRRWSSFGNDKFGSRIFITADAGKLWVADSERHRALCFDLKNGASLGTFGTSDAPGDDLTHLNRPEAIAARGNRAVVYDAGNQRLIKLSF